jgi:hypothetical protein
MEMTFASAQARAAYLAKDPPGRNPGKPTRLNFKRSFFAILVAQDWQTSFDQVSIRIAAMPKWSSSHIPWTSRIYIMTPSPVLGGYQAAQFGAQGFSGLKCETLLWRATNLCHAAWAAGIRNMSMGYSPRHHEATAHEMMALAAEADLWSRENWNRT